MRDFNRAVPGWAEDASAQPFLSDDFDRLRETAHTYMEYMADRLFAGQPKKRTGDEIRYGSKGGRTVSLAEGIWFDHESQTGGDAIDLASEVAGSLIEAVKMLREIAGAHPGQAVQTFPRPVYKGKADAALTKSEKVSDKVENVRVDARHFLPLGDPSAERVRKYLEGRGITSAPPEIMYCPKRGAMVGLFRHWVTGTAQEIQAVQYVYLTEDGDKAAVDPVKVTKGSIIGAACRLEGKGDPVLVEGMETGLSIWTVTGREVWVMGGIVGLPVGLTEHFKAAGGASGPSGVVTLAKDKDALLRDEKGELEASGKSWEKIERQIARERFNFEVRIPDHPDPKADWNDVLVKWGPDEVVRQFLGASVRKLEGLAVGDLEKMEVVPRDFLLDQLVMRSALSVMGAAPGVGKTITAITMALSMGSGQAIGRFNPDGIFRRVLVYVAEQDEQELVRLVRAAKEAVGLDDYHWDLAAGNVKFVCAGTSPICLAISDGGKSELVEEDIAALERAISDWSADCVILDPLMPLHRASENDGGAMDLLAGSILRNRIAIGMNIAVLVCHHTSQAGSSDDRAGDQTAIRGHTALMGAAKIGYTLNNLTSEKAQELRVPPGQEADVFTLTMAKSNVGPGPGSEPILLRRKVVEVGKDHIAAVVPVQEVEREDPAPKPEYRPRDWTGLQREAVVKVLENKMKSSGLRSLALLNAAHIVIEAGIEGVSDCFSMAKDSALRDRRGMFAKQLVASVEGAKREGKTTLWVADTASALQVRCGSGTTGYSKGG